MDDHVRMGIGDRLGDAFEQRQPRRESQVVRGAVEPHAVHMLHHEVGPPIVGDPAVEDARDARVLETGEDASFDAESLARRGGSGVREEHLDRDGLLEQAVGAAPPIDPPHAARRDGLDDLEHPEARAQQRVRLALEGGAPVERRGGRVLEESRRGKLDAPQRFGERQRFGRIGERVPDRARAAVLGERIRPIDRAEDAVPQLVGHGRSGALRHRRLPSGLCRVGEGAMRGPSPIRVSRSRGRSPGRVRCRQRPIPRRSGVPRRARVAG